MCANARSPLLLGKKALKSRVAGFWETEPGLHVVPKNKPGVLLDIHEHPGPLDDFRHLRLLL